MADTSTQRKYRWRDEKFYARVSNDIVNKVNAYQGNHNALASDYQKRNSGRKYTYEDAYVSDSADWADSVAQRRGSLDAEANGIIDYMYRFKDGLDADWFDKIISSLRGSKTYQNQMADAAVKDNEFWSSFGNEELVKEYGSAEEAYKYYQRSGGYSKKYSGLTYADLRNALAGLEDGEEKDWLTSYASSVDYDEKSKFDVAAGETEIKALEAEIQELADYYTKAQDILLDYTGDPKEYDRQAAKLYEKYGGNAREMEAFIKEKQQHLEEKRQYLDSAEYIQKGISLASVADNADFDQYSRYAGTETDGWWDKLWSDYGMGYTDLTYEYINNQNGIRDEINQKHTVLGADRFDMESPFEEKGYDHLKDDEIAVYNYYYAKEGKRAAEAYLAFLSATLKARKNARLVDRTSAFAAEHPVLASVASIGTSIGSGFEYIGDVIEYGTDKLAGKDAKMDTNSLALQTNAVRGAVSDKVDWEIGNWDAFDFLYNTTMSGIDSLAATAFGGAGGAVLGLSAAASATNDALERGMSSGQAFWNGLVSGVFEGLFESVSIGNFQALKEVSPKNFKDIIKNLGKSMLVNASEETLTEIANITYDTLANGEFANYTVEELKNGAWKEAALQIAEAGASGALMGVGMGAAGQTAGYMKNRKAEANTNAISKSLESYPHAKQKTIRSYIQSVDETIKDFVQSVKSGDLSFKRQKISDVSQRAAADIGDLLGIDVSGYTHNINTNGIQHILNRHGEKGNHDTTMSMEDDIARVGWVLENYDSVELLTENGEQVYSSSFRNKDNQSAPQIRFIKKIDGTYYVVEAACENEYKKLWVQSAYLTTKEDVTHASAEGQTTDHEATPDSAHASPSSSNSISKTEPGVKEENAYRVLENRVDGFYSTSEDGRTVLQETGEEVSVDEVVSVGGGKMTVRLDNGRTVDASEIDFANDSESYLFSAVSQIENITPGAATAIIKDYDPSSGQTVGEYLNGIDEAYTYGYHGYSEADLKAGDYTGKLTDVQRKSAYVLGQSARKVTDNAKVAMRKKMRTAAEAKKAEKRVGDTEKSSATAKESSAVEKSASNNAEVYFQDGKSTVKFDEHTGKYDEKRMAAVNYAKFLSKLGIGGKYFFYESYAKDGKRYYKDANGNEVEAPNGMYIEGDGSIHIDLNAGDYGQGTTLFTLSHELTHFIKEWSPDKFKALADFLIEEYGKTDMTMHERVLAKQNKLSEIRGKSVSYNEAFEEVVADAMSTMFTDGNLHEKLAKLRAKDKRLFNKIKQFFEKLVAKFRGVYAELTPEQKDARDVRAMKDAFDKIQTAFAEALVDASENFQAAEVQKNTTQEGDVKHQARPSAKDPSVLDPRTVTRNDVAQMLENVIDGKYPERTYIPVRISTPGIVQERLFTDDLPIIMPVSKVAQALAKDNGPIKGKNVRGHGLSVDDLITIIERMDSPDFVYSQADGRGAEVIKFENNSDNTVVIVEFDNNINSSHMNGYEGGTYNVSVTMFDVDGGNVGLFMYGQDKGWHEVFNKQKEGDPAKKFPATRPFTIEQDSLTANVSQPDAEVKSESAIKKSDRDGGTSNRYLLANAFEDITQNSVEYEMIQEYKNRIKILDEYEEKLAKLNAEIREIRFGTKGKRDTERLARLEAEAKNVAANINRNDKKLLSLETSEPLRKVLERERKKEAQKTKEHVKEIQQNKKVKAEQTELRHKIRKVVRDLDKILNRGNKKQNVKEDMKGLASKALHLAEYLFTDHFSNDDLIRWGITVDMNPREAALVKETEGILAQIYDHADSLTDEEFAALDEKRKRNFEKLREVLHKQRNERLKTPVYQLFSDLVTEYASLKNSKQDAVKAAYDPQVEEFLKSYLGEADGKTDADRKKALENMRVADMTAEELWKLYNAYTMVLHSVRNANKLFIKGKSESIDHMVERISSEFGSKKVPNKTVAVVGRNIANKIGWNYEKLYYALDRVGSEAFTELVMNIANSEDIVMQDVREAASFLDEMVKKYGFNDWAVNKKIDKEFLDSTGKKFNMTLGQLMSLYAYSRREGAWNHIEYGGFVFGEKALTNPAPATSYKLSREQCEAIMSLLTKEQKGYVEEMQKYLSETMGDKGNEVSMMLYGIKMFDEKNYFPIHIAGSFMEKAQESQAKEAAGFSSMTNAGFTHAQNQKAKAPFELEGFNEVWVDHVNEMSRYHGTVPALEDFRKVMNRSSYTQSDTDSVSMETLMINHYGQEAADYFKNLYKEANSGATRDKLEKNSQWLLSKFRKNSVAYSLSVLIQQPASLVRAYAMIDRKYFGFKGFGTLISGIGKAVSDKRTKAHTNAYNEMLRYAPGVTMAKEIGGFDTATGGSIRSYLLDTKKSLKQSMKTENLLGKGKAILNKVDDNAVANLPNLADKIAWIEIWNACKREVMTKRGHEFFPDQEAKYVERQRSQARQSRHSVDIDGKTKYSKRQRSAFFEENVFPPFNESHSDAHEQAERWARSESTEAGMQKIVSYQGQRYRIEAFSDMKYGYQIVEKVSEKSYKEEQDYGRGSSQCTAYESIQEAAGQIVTDDSKLHGVSGRGYGSDPATTQHRGKNHQVPEMDTSENRGRRSEHYSSRGHESGLLDRQGQDGSSLDAQEDAFLTAVGERFTEVIRATHQEAKYSERERNQQYSSQETDVDNFNIADYPRIKLSGSEQRRLESEAMTWNADKVGKVLHQTLSNQYTYVYYFDESHNIVVLNKYRATNIHERQSVINDKRNGRKVDRNNGGVGSRGRIDSSAVFGTDGREADQSDRSSKTAESETRASNRRGYAEGASNSDKAGLTERYSAQEVDDTSDLDVQEEAFLTAVGQRFTEVIRATQVYDSIFAKSPMLKSKSLAVQYLVSFMNEPNTVANMAEKAVRDFTRGNRKQGVKTAAVLIHCVIYTSLLKSVIYAMRDDDEDETYTEKYIEAVVGSVMDDFMALNYIPLARDVWSYAQGHDVERNDMAILADAIDAVGNVIKNANTDTEDMTEEQLSEFDKKITEANWKLVESIAVFFGIPAKNIRREINAVINHARIAYTNAGKTTALSAWDSVYQGIVEWLPDALAPKYTKSDKLYGAIVSGDVAYQNRLKATYKDENAYENAVVKVLKENDPRIHAAAQAGYKGNSEERNRIFREIKGEGKVSSALIIDAINSELNSIRNKAEPEKVTGEYAASDFIRAVSAGEAGKAQAAMDDIISTYVANGKTQTEAEQAFVSDVKSGTREAYNYGDLNSTEAENMLIEYADMDKEDAVARVEYWAFCNENPKHADLSQSKVEKFREFAEPADVSLEVYAQFVKDTKGLTDKKDEWGDVVESTRDQVLAVIDSLPLTWEQKDALYLAAGYAENKIWDVPW